MVATVEKVRPEYTEAILAEWTAHLRDRDRAEGTIVAYRKALSGFLTWLAANGGCPHGVTRLDIIQWRQHLLSLRRKPATINKCLYAVRGWARLHGVDVTEIRNIGTVNTAPRGLDRNTVNALLRAAEQQGPQANALIQMFLGTGLRLAELAALRIDDLDMSDRSGWVTVRDGKGSTFRRVPIPSEARRALRIWSALRGEPSTPALWTGQRGPLSRSGVRQMFGRACRGAGLRGVTPHTLRHTYAKRTLAGIDETGRQTGLEHLQRLLGHRSIMTTARYVQPSEDDLERVIRVAHG